MNPTALTINRLAQEILPLEDGIQWFSDAGADEQRNIMREFDFIIMTKNGWKEARQKIMSLPDLELTKALQLWVAIFSIADSRRRSTVCKDGCTHEWHNLEP